MLLNQITGRARDRAGAAPSNYELTLPGHDFELAGQLAKDPYMFDFRGLSGRVAERDLERALVARLRDTWVAAALEAPVDVDGRQMTLAEYLESVGDEPWAGPRHAND